MTARVVGIDLGTTNSVVAYIDATGQPTCVTNFQGAVLTPSAVLIDGKTALIGQEARRAAAQHPHCYAECFKRHMGEDVFPLQIDGRSWRPELLSAFVLRRLKQDATRRLGEVADAVITVPAYFDERRRRATQDAGAIAGWHVVDLINEPTAAAIAYAHREGTLDQKSGTERILVYDLGGGTFDSTVLEVRSGREYRTVATDGEVCLGGHDWDARLCQYLGEQFKAKTGRDPLAEADGRIEFAGHTRTIKHALSLKESTRLPVSFDGQRAVLEATREKFEKLTADLLQRSRVTTELVLEQAKCTWEEIDKVLLVGGSTRMPMVVRMLQDLTGKEPDSSLSADEAVAHGAAVYAQLLQTKQARVINVNSHTYSLVCRNRRLGQMVAMPLIPKNSPLPGESTRSLPVDRSGRSEFRLVICEGESENPKLCETVGEVRVQDLPVDDPKQWVVDVNLTCREDGNLAVEATVRDPHVRQKVVKNVAATLLFRHGMTAEEVAKARRLLDSFELD